LRVANPRLSDDGGARFWYTEGEVNYHRQRGWLETAHLEGAIIPAPMGDRQAQADRGI